MLNITEMANELQEFFATQETLETLEHSDYVKVVVRAVKQFFVDINHPQEYNITSWTTDDDGYTVYDRDFLLDEEAYIMILCKIEFIERLQHEVNVEAMSYATNAITVSNADKPFANLQSTLDKLRLDRITAFNKMVRYTLGET